MTEGPLAGLKVLDASQMLAGPICGMRLGDLGADVLKIEPPETGEWVRTHGFANAELKGETTAFLGLNRNKRSVAINLKNKDGVEAFYDLVRQADVFLQNYRVGTAERLGIGYEHLRAINPRLIYCSISGYGEEGPLKDRPGQDLLVQAMSGSMYSVGSKNDPPLPGALWAVDSMTGYQAAIGILSALIARGRTGQGQKVSVNMLAVVMDCQTQELTTYLNLGIMPERTEAPFAHAWVTAPYGAYPTQDGYIVISQSALNVLGEALGSERLQQMVKWSDGMDHRDEIYELVKALTPTRTTQQWIEILDSYKLWSGPIYKYSDLEHDPHVQMTDMITSVQHPTIGKLRMPNIPLRLSETPGSIRKPPPLLGEHTLEVLQEWCGYSTAQLDALRSVGAIT